MRFGLVIRPVLAGLIPVSIIAAGCQQSVPSGAVRPVAMASVDGRYAQDQNRPARDEPYVDVNYTDEDDQAPGFFHRVGAGTASVFSSVFAVPVGLFKWFSGDRPGVAARMMEDGASADTRREGINKLLKWDFTHRDPYLTRYRQIAQFDPDQTVRATAIRASNRVRDSRATPVFVRSLSDKDQWVRLEACKALANVPDMAAEQPLLKIIGDRDENRDIRIAAADALKHYRTVPVARALCNALSDRDFAVSWQAHKSLQYLTGLKYGYDPVVWTDYATGPHSVFK